MKNEFSTDKFSLNKEGFHLLRNKFKYKSFKVNELSNVTIKRGFDLSNWLFVGLFGIALFGGGLYSSFRIYTDLILGDQRYYIEFLLFPLFFFLLGGYSVFIALRRSKVVTLKLGNKMYYFSLREIDEKGEMEDFIQYLDQIKKRPIMA
ncbi:hypothetical protein [Persicobacter psychrovividus]|uniref:Uncharacterized protein n=1 Tax=Persicobacter psychrovividus TaxID=387638 RepID=A0ABN6L4R9_9BACT|nr:hypothetical protein PEPS_03910 [Persicobacter psychrovividus]